VTFAHLLRGKTMDTRTFAEWQNDHPVLVTFAHLLSGKTMDTRPAPTFAEWQNDYRVLVTFAHLLSGKTMDTCSALHLYLHPYLHPCKAATSGSVIYPSIKYKTIKQQFFIKGA
jgi:hypothetical protein